MNGSLVSVIIPTYNRSQTIKRAIDSVLAQTYGNMEILVVDDSSVDDTSMIVSQIKDDRIVYLKHGINKGAGSARNTGLRAAKGAYIAFQDSDDEWVSTKIEKQMAVFENGPSELGVVYTDMLQMNRGGIAEYKEAPNIISGKIINSHTMEYQVFGIGIVTSLIRRECFEKAGLFDERFSRFVDLELFIRLVKEYRFYRIKEPLIKYYYTPVRISSSVDAYITAEKLLLEKYAEDIKNNKKFLSKRYYRIAVAFLIIGRFACAKTYYLKSIKAYLS